MSENITLIDRAAQHTAIISARVGTMKMPSVMGTSFESIIKHFKANGIEMTSSSIPFTVYRNIDWESMKDTGFLANMSMMFVKKWDIEIGIPCPDSLTETDEIRKLTLDAGQYVRAIHKGPYRKVGDTYTRIRKFAEDQKLGPFENYSIEFYLNDPTEVKPEDIETEVLVPLR